MSQLLDFYRGIGSDGAGRTLSKILVWPDDELEQVHNFIQWLFPLPEPSQYNPNAPLLTHEEIAAFRREPLLRQNLRRSFERILAFLGLAIDAEGVAEGPNFDARRGDVWDFPNHNWLRITRILRSLRLLGLEAEVRALFCWLEKMYLRRRFPITEETIAYWTAAVQS